MPRFGEITQDGGEPPQSAPRLPTSIYPELFGLPKHLPKAPAETPAKQTDPAIDSAAVTTAIATQRERDKHQSYLSKAIDFVWFGDEDALTRLENFQSELKKLGPADLKHAGDWNRRIERELSSFNKANHLQDEICHYGSGFLKTAALFLRGRTGNLSTAAIFALDQASPADALSYQLFDGVLGAAKGTALRGVISAFGPEKAIASKGVALGISNRILDTTLNRSTYLDANGDFNAAAGWSRITSTAFNPRAMAADAIVFTVSHGLIRTAMGTNLTRSPLLSTMFTGTTFGVTSGAAGEIMRQQQAGEDFSFGKVAYRAFLQGAVDTLAAVPGGVQADPAASAWVKNKTEKFGQSVKYNLKKAHTELTERQSYNFVEDNILGTKVAEPKLIETADRGTVEARRGEFIVTENYEHKRMYLMNQEQFSAVIKNPGDAPGERSWFTSKVAKGGELVDTYDHSFMRAKPGELIVQRRIEGQQSFVMSEHAMWSKYKSRFHPPATAAGSFVRLMDEITNPPTKFDLDVRAGRLWDPHHPTNPIRKPL